MYPGNPNVGKTSKEGLLLGIQEKIYSSKIN
jgi:hypothetical protein